MATNFDAEPVTATERVADRAHDVLDQAARRAARAELKLRDSAARGEEVVRDAARETQVKTRELTEEVQGYVREHPLATAGIAFAAGLLCSALLKR